MSSKERLKKLRRNLFVNLIGSGVVDDRHSNSSAKMSMMPDSKEGYTLHPLGPTSIIKFFCFAQRENLETTFENNHYKIYVLLFFSNFEFPCSMPH